MNNGLSQFSLQMSQLCPSSCPSLSPLFSMFVPVSQLFHVYVKRVRTVVTILLLSLIKDRKSWDNWVRIGKPFIPRDIQVYQAGTRLGQTSNETGTDTLPALFWPSSVCGEIANKSPAWRQPHGARISTNNPAYLASEAGAIFTPQEKTAMYHYIRQKSKLRRLIRDAVCKLEPLPHMHFICFKLLQLDQLLLRLERAFGPFEGDYP
jgi:hypothetical protein